MDKILDRKTSDEMALREAIAAILRRDIWLHSQEMEIIGHYKATDAVIELIKNRKATS
jgi:hypothetical protein